MNNVSNLTHLEILKGYKTHLYTVKDNETQIETWLVGVVNFFQQAVYTNEVGNTEIISEMNSFVVKFKKYETNKELAKASREMIDWAETIIDKAIKATAPTQSLAA